MIELKRTLVIYQQPDSLTRFQRWLCKVLGLERIVFEPGEVEHQVNIAVGSWMEENEYVKEIIRDEVKALLKSVLRNELIDACKADLTLTLDNEKLVDSIVARINKKQLK